jgi:hypothetical protein
MDKLSLAEASFSGYPFSQKNKVLDYPPTTLNNM